MIRHQSASVPVYAGEVHGRTRYTIAYFIDGRRQRRMFTDLDDAKREAKFAAEKIQLGLQATNDLRPAEREAYLGLGAVGNHARPLKINDLWGDGLLFLRGGKSTAVNHLSIFNLTKTCFSGVPVRRWGYRLKRADLPAMASHPFRGRRLPTGK